MAFPKKNDGAALTVLQNVHFIRLKYFYYPDLSSGSVLEAQFVAIS